MEKMKRMQKMYKIQIKYKEKRQKKTNKKITRRTTGARGCYFQTSVFQVK